MISRAWEVRLALLLVVVLSSACGASITQQPLNFAAYHKRTTLGGGDLGSGAAAPSSLFAPIPQSMPTAHCMAFTPPRPLMAPGITVAADRLVVVDFVVGRQGNIESLLVVEGADNGTGREMEGILRQWRFRPAFCDGVPVEAEGRLEIRPQIIRVPHRRLPQ